LPQFHADFNPVIKKNKGFLLFFWKKQLDFLFSFRKNFQNGCFPEIFLFDNLIFPVQQSTLFLIPFFNETDNQGEENGGVL